MSQPVQSLDDVEGILELFHDAAALVADVRLVLSDARGASAALGRLADRITTTWSTSIPDPDELRRAIVRGVGQAAVRASAAPTASVVSPREAVVIAKLERAVGDHDAGDYWEAVAHNLVPAPAAMRLPGGSSAYWALQMTPLDLVPPAFAVWWDDAARRCVAAELENERSPAPRSSPEVDERDAVDALTLLADDETASLRLAQLWDRLNKHGPGLRAYVSRLVDGSAVGLSTEKIAALVSSDCGHPVSAAAIRKYRERLSDLVSFLDGP